MNRMSIREIGALARERARKALEKFVNLRAGFSGVRLEQAQMNMIAEYHSSFWDEMVSMSKEYFPTKESEQSLDALLLELHKRDIEVQPLHFSLDMHRVNISGTCYRLRIKNGVIHIHNYFSSEKQVNLDEAVIADIMIEVAKATESLPEIYEDVCRRLQLEKKEQELLESTAKGLVQDILKDKNATLNFKGIELKFTLTKGNFTKEFHSCLGLLREDLSRILEDIQSHEDYIASKSTDNNET